MAIFSCHVSIKLPPKISDGQQKSSAVVLVNCRGPPSIPCAELGIHGLNR